MTNHLQPQVANAGKLPIGRSDAGDPGRTAEHKDIGSPNSHGVRHAEQALRVIEGEISATQYLTRLRADQAGPDELASTLSKQFGPALCGFCRVIEKALGVQHE